MTVASVATRGPGGPVDPERVLGGGRQAVDPHEVHAAARHDAPLADQGLDLAVVVGPEGDDDLVGPDREELCVADHALTLMGGERTGGLTP